MRYAGYLVLVKFGIRILGLILLVEISQLVKLSVCTTVILLKRLAMLTANNSLMVLSNYISVTGQAVKSL